MFCVSPEVPQLHVCKEEEVLTNQQLWDQECNSSRHQEEPEPPQTEEEPEEVCSSQLGLKQDSNNFKLSSPKEESDQDEYQTLDWNPEEPSEESQVKIPFITCVVSEGYRELLPHQLSCVWVKIRAKANMNTQSQQETQGKTWKIVQKLH